MPYSFYRQRPRAGCSLGAKASGLGPEDRGFKSLHPDKLCMPLMQYIKNITSVQDKFIKCNSFCGIVFLSNLTIPRITDFLNFLFILDRCENIP